MPVHQEHERFDVFAFEVFVQKRKVLQTTIHKVLIGVKQASVKVRTMDCNPKYCQRWNTIIVKPVLMIIMLYEVSYQGR